MTRRSSVLLTLLLAGPAAAQPRADVVLTLRDANQFFDLTLTNAGDQRGVEYVEFQPNEGTPLDTLGTLLPAGAVVAPAIADNADGVSAPSVRVTPAAPLAQGQVLSVAVGDMDGATLTSFAVRVKFAGAAQPASVQLVQSGGTWRGAAVLAPVGPAVPVRLRWTPPTTNEDGTPYTNPDGYWAYWGAQPWTESEAGYAGQFRVADPGATSADVLVPAGSWYFVMTAVNTDGVSSAHSNFVMRDAVPAPPAPSPPVGLSTQGQEIPVYTFLITRDSLDAVQIGTAPAGVACAGDMAIQARGIAETLYLVPRNAVQVFPGVFPESVFAPCAVP